MNKENGFIQRPLSEVKISNFKFHCDFATLGLNCVGTFDFRALRTRLMMALRWGFYS
jgi:hypothetical protein